MWFIAGLGVGILFWLPLFAIFIARLDHDLEVEEDDKVYAGEL